MEEFLKLHVPKINAYLGPNYNECHYQKLLNHILNKHKFETSIELSKEIFICYDGETVNIGNRRYDIVIHTEGEEDIIIECKAMVGNATELNKKQLLSYLELNKTRVGFLVKFFSYGGYTVMSDSKEEDNCKNKCQVIKIIS